MPNADDFDKMSMMSRGSIRSKASVKVGRVTIAQTPIKKPKPLVFIDVNLG